MRKLNLKPRREVEGEVGKRKISDEKGRITDGGRCLWECME
jgi:hypothetical protein